MNFKYYSDPQPWEIKLGLIQQHTTKEEKIKSVTLKKEECMTVNTPVIVVGI